MADLKGLLSDPQFQQLTPGTQKQVLGRIDPGFGNLSDAEFTQFKQRLGVSPAQQPATPNMCPTALQRYIYQHIPGAEQVGQTVHSVQSPLAESPDDSPVWKALIGVGDSMKAATTGALTIPGVETAATPSSVNPRDPSTWHNMPVTDPLYDLRPLLSLWQTDPARAAGQTLPFVAGGAANSDAVARGVDAITPSSLPSVGSILQFARHPFQQSAQLLLDRLTPQQTQTMAPPPITSWHGGIEETPRPNYPAPPVSFPRQQTPTPWDAPPVTFPARANYPAPQATPQTNLEGVPQVYRDQVQAQPFLKDPMDAVIKDKMILKYLLQKGFTKEAFDTLNMDQKKALIRQVPTPNKSPYRWSDDLESRAPDTIRAYLPEKK